MSVENINSKSSETIGIKAKGIARQVLNLVNQALFDGLQASTDFSALLKNQSPQAGEEKNISEEKKCVDCDIEVTEKTLNEQDTVVQNVQSTEKEDQLIVVAEAKELPENADISAENTEIVDNQSVDQQISVVEQTVVQEPSVTQAEMAAANVINNPLHNSQQVVTNESNEPIVEESAPAVVASIVEEDSAAEPQVMQNAEIPQEIADKIKNLKTPELKEAALKQAENEVKNAQQKVATDNTESPPAAPVLNELNQISPENIITNKANPEKINIGLTLQQFITQSAVKDSIQSAAVLVEQIKNLNPDHINPAKSANAATKIAAESGLSIASAKASNSAINSLSAANNAAFNSQLSQDSGQKLENGKSSKALTKSQAASTLEKVEAVLKKISESKDGTTISLRLDPPQLGSVKADVSLKEGVLHARLTAENPQVLQLLRERASDLQVTLRKMGLEVEKVSVSVNSGDYETSAGDAGDRQGKNGTRQGSFFSAQADFADSSEIKIIDHWIA